MEDWQRGFWEGRWDVVNRLEMALNKEKMFGRCNPETELEVVMKVIEEVKLLSNLT